MASISTDAGGNRSVQFVSPHDRKRRTIRLGKVPKKAAESFRLRVEALVFALASKSSPDPETGGWVASLPDATHAKLVAVGLVEARRQHSAVTLSDFLKEYIARRALDSKGGTLLQLRVTAADLTTFFGAGTSLRDITQEGAGRFRDYYLERGLAPATSQRRLKMCRMFWKDAVRRNLAASDPFEGARINAGNPADRRHYIIVADAERLIKVCPPTGG